MQSSNEAPALFFADIQAWELWLGKHYGQTAGLWIKFAKKSAGVPTLTYDEALEVALCYGWIDGQLKSLDANYYLQKFTPRRPKSTWSKRNIGKVTALIAAGKMHAAGLAEIEAAKRDGRWEQAYDSPSNMKMPSGREPKIMGK
jgi:uncharacterized protein YdeI (YjbR/CyaY-like superfamily)